MDHRPRLYENYASGHTSCLYGQATLASIRARFSSWERYFGNWLPKNKDANILDIGCGHGNFVYWLREKGYQNVAGIDRSKEQVELGKKLGIKGISETLIEEHLPDHAQEYDLISARDVLEHFNKGELLPLLDQIREALRPGGAFVAQTVNAANPLWGRLRYGDFTHEVAFTEGSIRQLLSAAGFKDVEVLPQRPVAHGLISGVRALLWRGIEVLIRGYLLVEIGSGRGVFTQNLLVRARK